jgi:hypothetical protein
MMGSFENSNQRTDVVKSFEFQFPQDASLYMSVSFTGTKNGLLLYRYVELSTLMEHKNTCKLSTLLSRYDTNNDYGKLQDCVLKTYKI